MLSLCDSDTFLLLDVRRLRLLIVLPQEILNNQNKNDFSSLIIVTFDIS